MPAFPGRTFRQFLTTDPMRRVGRNEVNWIVEYVSAPSQMGTHVDGLNHLHVGERMYNGHRLADVVAEHGTTKLGIETLPQVVTRGVLLDIAAVRGVERLGAGDVITPVDADDRARPRRAHVEPGDAVLFHTGWGSLWGVDNDVYVAGEPGPGHGARRVARRAAGRDHRLRHLELRPGAGRGPRPSRSSSPRPSTPATASSCSRTCALAELAAAGVAEFLFVVSHPKLRGATGAWVAPARHRLI